MCGVRHGPVVLVLAKVLATPLVLCLGSVVCSVVILFLCLATSVSRLELVFSPGHLSFLFALGFSRLLRPLGRGGAPLKVQMP